MAEGKEIKKEKKGSVKYATARGKTTRYSCLYSTMPNKSRSPPKV